MKPKNCYQKKEKGLKKSEEHKHKLSLSKVGKKNPFYGKKHSKETRELISKMQNGKEVSEAFKEKMRNKQIGYKYSEEAKKNMSIAQKKVWTQEKREKHSSDMKKLSKLKCPWCGYESISHGNLRRWHFDNCKENPANNKEEIIKQRRENHPRYSKN